MMRLIALLFCLLATPLLAADLPPGNYVGDRGSGLLKIVPATQNGQKFDLSSVGANGHSCALDGDIRRGMARLDTGEKGQDCVVNFVRQADGSIEVSTSNKGAEYCRSFCGMRAAFEGNYAKPPAGCLPAEVRKKRQNFKQLYDRKDYSGAQQTLQPVLNTCGPFMDWLANGWIRNDLALAQFKAGDAKACLKTLDPLTKDAASTDEDIREKHPPVDAESWLPIVRAARTNLKLCREKQ